MPDSVKEAIILLGHGSRVPDAGKNMEKVALGLREQYAYEIVEVCYMSRLGPHFPEIFKKCVDQGAQQVTVVPYFLHEGLHLVLDIPEMMQEVARQYPGIRVVLGDNLGFDDALVDLVHRRITGSRGFDDVRDMVLAPKDKYPVPAGQCEFVAMPPEEAAKYRSGDSDSRH